MSPSDRTESNPQFVDPFDQQAAPFAFGEIRSEEPGCTGGYKLVVLTLAPPVYGKTTYNTIDSSALVNDQGRHIIASGPIECTAGQTAYIRLTVTQRSTGAMAEGRTRIICVGIGAIQQWGVHAATQGKETFEEGAATAVALARTTARGVTDDAHQWLVPITLVEE